MVEALCEILVDNNKELRKEILHFILFPEELKSINRFASLLNNLNDSSYIVPLLNKINTGIKDDLWLLDFLYAAGRLLDEHAIEMDFPTGLLEKLSTWTLQNEGELAWKAVDLLKYYETEESVLILLQKLNQKDMYLVHMSCVIGLMNYNQFKYLPLLKEITQDSSKSPELRMFCNNILVEQERNSTI